MIAHVQRVLLTASSREWEARLGEVGVACGTVNDVAGALVEPQTRARGLVVQNEHPAYGRYEHVRGPLPTQGTETLRPAPLLGEHTTDVLEGLGYSPARIAALRDAGDRRLSVRRARSRRASALVGFLDHPPVVVGDPRARERRDRRRGEVGPRGREGGPLGCLDADEGVARRARDLPGDLTPAVVELRARNHFVEQSQRECGLGVEHAARRHQRQRPPATHQCGEPLDAAPCRHDPERHLVERAPHVVGGDPDVARHRNLGASAVGVAVDRRDHGNGQRRQPVEHRRAWSPP